MRVAIVGLVGVFLGLSGCFGAEEEKSSTGQGAASSPAPSGGCGEFPYMSQVEYHISFIGPGEEVKDRLVVKNCGPRADWNRLLGNLSYTSITGGGQTRRTDGLPLRYAINAEANKASLELTKTMKLLTTTSRLVKPGDHLDLCGRDGPVPAEEFQVEFQDKDYDRLKKENGVGPSKMKLGGYMSVPACA